VVFRLLCWGRLCDSEGGAITIITIWISRSVPYSLFCAIASDELQLGFHAGDSFPASSPQGKALKSRPLMKKIHGSFPRTADGAQPRPEACAQSNHASSPMTRLFHVAKSENSSRDRVDSALGDAGWNRSQAARQLKISSRSLLLKIKRHWNHTSDAKKTRRTSTGCFVFGLVRANASRREMARILLMDLLSIK
jgi:hypothetical protein